MKARIAFRYAIALVLFVAAISHATERRDPVMNPEQTQSGSASSAESPKHTSTHPAKKSHRSDAKTQNQARVTPKKNADRGVGTAGNGK